MERVSKLSRRRFVAISGAAAASVALSACAAQAPVPAAPAPQEAQPPSEAEAPEAPAAQPAGAPTEVGLLLVDWNEQVRNDLDSTILPAFEKDNPGLKVVPDYTDWGQLDAKVMTAAAGGVAPDLFMADGVEWAPKYFDRGIITDMDQYVEAAGGDKVLADFYAKAIDEGSKYKGKLVIIPYVLDNRGLFYRKDFMQAAGLDPEKPPQKWDEFRDAAIKMTKRSGETWEVAGWHNDTGQYNGFQVLCPLLWENGGQVLNEDGTKAIFNSDAGVEALQLWTTMVRDDKVSPVENMPNVGDLSAFVAGQQGMNFNGYGVLQQVTNYAPDLMDKIGVTVLGQKEKGSLWYANGYLMTKGKKQDAAWKLVSHLVLKDENFMKYLVAMSSLPPRKSITATAPHLTPLHKTLIEDVMAAPASHTSPQVPYTLEVLQRIDDAVQKAIFGQAAPKEAMDVAAEEANAIIDRYLSGSG